MSFVARHNSFDTMHPTVPLVYATGTVGVVMFCNQPVFQLIGLAGGLLFSAVIRGPRETLRGLRWQLPLLLIVALANPLFSHYGQTVLSTIGPVVVRLEPLAYGACMGMMMASTVTWLECAARAVGEEGLRSVGDRTLPVVALVVSIAARLVPQLVRRSGQVNGVADACTASRRPKSSPLQAGARVSTMLMTWSLEDSLERSDAMRARGWDAAAMRSSYRPHPFTERDALRLAMTLVLLMASALLAWRASLDWHFYPTMPRLTVWAGYLPFALQVLLPSLYVLIDRLRWRMLP